MSGSNQLGEARGGRTGMLFLGEPLASAKNVHGCCSKQYLKSELLASDVACASHLPSSYALGNRPFNTSSLGIQRSKLRGLLALASSIGLLMRTQNQHSGWTLGTLCMQGTGPTRGKRKPHPNDRFAMSIVRHAPTLTDFPSRAHTRRAPQSMVKRL